MSSSLSVEKANSPTPSSPNMFSSPRPTRPLRTTNIAVRTDYKPSSFATSSHRVQAASRISQNLTDLAISDNNTNAPPVDPGASLSQVEANVMARSIKGMDGKQGNNATQTSHVLASNYGPERHFAQEPTTTQSARPVRNNPYPLKASSRQVSHTSVNQQALVSPSFDAPMVGAASQPVQKVSFQMNPKEQPQVSPALQWAPGYTNPTTHVNPYTKNATSRAPVSPRCQQIMPETIHEREDPQERYELHTIIRDSIFGKVFAAIDKKTGQKVAIKLSNLQLLRSGRSVNGRPVLENPIHESAMMRKICPISLAPNFDVIGQVSELEALQPTSMQVDSIPQGEGETVDIPRRFSPSDDKIMSVPIGEKGLALGLPPLPPMHRNVLPLLAEYADGLVHWMVMPLMQGELFDEVRRIPRPSARHLQAHRRSMIKPNTAADAISPSTAVARHTQSDSKAADPTDNFNGFNHVHTAACNFSDIQRKFQQYFREMVEGLSYIHARNFCHLDFSLENILIDFDGSLKVSDFGVARELPTEGTLLPAFRHEKPGKLRYMAPEVLASQPFDGKKADSFGLGVTLFCMLTAHPPFEMPSPSDPGFALIAQGNLAHLLKLLRVDHLVTIKAYEVLNGLLCPDWTRRWSLEQVRAHGYFRDDILEDEEDTIDVVMGKSASAPVCSAPSTRPEGIPA